MNVKQCPRCGYINEGTALNCGGSFTDGTPCQKNLSQGIPVNKLGGKLMGRESVGRYYDKKKNCFSEHPFREAPHLSVKQGEISSSVDSEEPKVLPGAEKLVKLCSCGKENSVYLPNGEERYECEWCGRFIYLEPVTTQGAISAEMPRTERELSAVKDEYVVYINGRCYPLAFENGIAYIGREHQPDALADELTVSRTHCTLKDNGDGTFLLTDTSSYHTKVINGAKETTLRKGETHRLRLGEIFYLVYTKQVAITVEKRQYP